MEYQIITRSSELEQVCQQAMQHSVVMLDTEFVRVRTFHAQLGLIQLYDGVSVSLIDPTTIDDMTSFVALLQAPQVLKVLHACGEDLEVFQHVFGCVPTPLMDTQILAAFLGHGLSTGFAALVHHCLGIEVDKSESRTDWMARPLTSRQLDYAAADVFYLLPMYQQLRQQVEQTNWLDAVFQESHRQAQKRVQSYDISRAYIDIKGAWQLNPKQLAILQLLATWRYEEALKRDLALNFVVRESDLLSIARLELTSLKRMEEEGMDPRAVKRHGHHLSQLVRQGQAMTEAQYPAPIIPISEYRGYKQLFKRLKDQVKNMAETNHLAAEFLASRKQLNELISWIWKHQENPDALPDLMQGWRKPLLGETLSQSIRTSGI